MKMMMRYSEKYDDVNSILANDSGFPIVPLIYLKSTECLSCKKIVSTLHGVACHNLCYKEEENLDVIIRTTIVYCEKCAKKEIKKRCM